MKIIDITREHYPTIAGIYKEGLDTGIASFETDIPDWSRWDAEHLPFGRIAAQYEGTIRGWASLAPVSGRCVYKGVAECSIYISTYSRGQGLGTFLLEHLIRISEQNGIWTLNSSIFSNNIASKRLHLKCGFREIGYKERVGLRDGSWHDNILLERRSHIIGI